MTTDSEAFKQIMAKLDKIESMIAKPAIADKWVDEQEAMKITGLGKSSLRKRRKKNTITWSTESGRNIKYLRKDLEEIITKNATR